MLLLTLSPPPPSPSPGKLLLLIRVLFSFLEATAENDLNCLLRQLEEVENTMRELEQDDGGFTRVRSAINYFDWIDTLIFFFSSSTALQSGLLFDDRSEHGV